jgi:Ca2+-binding EF-hand superfamily protein
LPAGILQVHVIEGKGLRPVDGRQDPYVVLSVDGQAAAIKKKTKVVTDGGSDLVWDEVLELDIVDHYDLNIECYDHDLLADDALIGKCTVSLLPVFKKGEIDTWVTLRSNQEGASSASGDIHLVFTFDGPYGIKYPQNQPGIDSFDETQRIQYLRSQPKEEPKPEGSLTVEHQLEGPRDTTFSDDEIEAAFRFVDLDKNGYIGANELRHCLICMGEMITDEEVDMMITMVDGDGDGQVSYTEFYNLVTDPDPGRPDFGKTGVSAAHKDMKRNADDAAKRAKEAERREEKRKMLSSFVEENNVGSAELSYAVDKALEIPLLERKEGIDFKTFCRLNQVDPTGEYLAMFNLFDLDDTGLIDFKTITLGMLNFVDLPKEDRCDFVFRIFDEDASGLLSMDELLAVLAANHMQSTDAVKRKAATIMNTVDKDGNGELSMDEFRTVGQKFPNILFPSFNKNSEQD